MNDPSGKNQKLIEENALLKQKIQKLEKSAAEFGKTRQQTDKKFDAIFQCSPDVITVTDASSGSLLDVNDSFLQLTGYTREEVIGSSTKELNIWGNIEDRVRIVGLLKSGKNVDKVELSFRTKSGELRQMLFSSRLIEVDGRQLIIANTHDVTDHNVTEEKLLESEEKYRTILEDMADVYFEVDIRGNIAFVNTSSCKKSGYAKEELLGMPFTHLYGLILSSKNCSFRPEREKRYISAPEFMIPRQRPCGSDLRLPSRVSEYLTRLHQTSIGID